MPDQEEIEIKFVLDDPQALRTKLIALGASPQVAQFESNMRLDDAAHSLAARGIVLRLRRTESQAGVRHIFTLKTPTPDLDPAYRVRREIEFTFSDEAAMLAALAVLGYAPYWRYEKRRETLIWDKVKAEIDQLPFGWFLELEGAKDAIRTLANKLGLDMADGLTLSYAEIFQNVRLALGLEMIDLTFEAFQGIVVHPDAYRGL